MKLGTSLALVAVGLILRYAVDFDVPGIDILALGSILFFVGLLGLALIIGMELAQRPRRPRPAAEPRRSVPPPREPERAYDPVIPSRPSRSADERTRVLDEETRRLR